MEPPLVRSPWRRASKATGSTQACWPQTPRLADDPPPLPSRRLQAIAERGIDEETLGIRAVEITGSHIGDAPILPDLLDQIPEGQEIGSVTGELPADAPSVRAPLATPIAESCSWPSAWTRNAANFEKRPIIDSEITCMRTERLPFSGSGFLSIWR